MYEIEKISPKQVRIECSPEIIDDLIMVLSRLLDLAKTIKVQKKFAEAQARAKSAAELAIREARFRDFSRQLYQRYLELVEVAENRLQAVRTLKAEFSLDSYSVELYIREGKRLEKEDIRSSIRAGLKKGTSISELVKTSGLSYHTVRRIQNEA